MKKAIFILVGLIVLTACVDKKPQIDTMLSEEQATNLMRSRILQSYSYTEHKGSSLYLKNIEKPDKEECRTAYRDYFGDKVYYNTCYKVTYRYEVDSEDLPKSVKTIEVSSLVLGNHVTNFSYTEIR